MEYKGMVKNRAREFKFVDFSYSFFYINRTSAKILIYINIIS